MDAEHQAAGLAQFVVFMGRAPGDSGGEGLVDGQIDAENLVPIHALEGDLVARLVGDGDAHGHADFSGLAGRILDQLAGIVQGQAFNGQHERSPPKNDFPVDIPAFARKGYGGIRAS